MAELQNGIRPGQNRIPSFLTCPPETSPVCTLMKLPIAPFPLPFHRSRAHEPGVPGKCLFDQVRRVFPRGMVESPEVIILEHRPVLRVDAFVDDLDRALFRGRPPEVGQSLFGDDHVHVVLAVIDVGDHRDDAGDVSPGRHGGRGKDRDERVSGEVAGTPDAVDDPRAVDVGRVDVAVQVELHAPVHRQDAQPLDDPDVIADRLGAQEDLVLVRVDVLPEFFDHGRRYGKRRRRRKGDLPGVDEREHPVLDHLGVHGQVLEIRIQQAVQHRVGDVAHAGLKREEVPGESPFLHLVLEEIENVP